MSRAVIMNSALAILIVLSNSLCAQQPSSIYEGRVVYRNPELHSARVQVAGVSYPLDPHFTKIVVDSRLEEGWGLACKDMDKDGDIDIVITQSNAGLDRYEIDWYENLGHYEFVFHELFVSDGEVFHVEAIDLEEDGDVDVVFGRVGDNRGLHVLVNDGEMNFSAALLTEDIYWKFKVIDLNRDGFLDIVGNNDTWRTTIHWVEQDANNVFVSHLIDAACGDAYGIDAADMDADGDIDIVQGSVNEYNDLYWYENDGNEVFTKHFIDQDFDSPSDMACVDIDDDNDVDIVVPSSSSVHWYENDGAGQFTAHMIADSISDIWFVGVADIDNNQTRDIVTGGRAGYEFVWFSNDGQEDFSGSFVDDAIQYPQDFDFVDFDGNGSLEIVLVSGSCPMYGCHVEHGQLSIYINHYGMCSNLQ